MEVSFNYLPDQKFIKVEVFTFDPDVNSSPPFRTIFDFSDDLNNRIWTVEFFPNESGDHFFRLMFEDTNLSDDDPNRFQELTTIKTIDSLEDLDLGPHAEFRIYMGDNDPDRYYNFAPPDLPTLLVKSPRKRSFVWQDVELGLALELGESEIRSSLQPNFNRQAHKHLFFLASAGTALRMVVPRWINNAFEYNIGGNSMSVTKHTDYLSYLDTLSARLSELITAANENLKITKGIRRASTAFRNVLGGVGMVQGGGGRSSYQGSVQRPARLGGHRRHGLRRR